MKLKFNVFIFFTFLLITNTLTAAIIKPVVEKPTNKFSIIAAKKIIKQAEQTFGRKLKLKEKIALFIIGKKINNNGIDKEALGKKYGKKALIAAGAALLLILLSVLLPPLSIISLLLMIASLIFGIKGIKLNKITLWLLLHLPLVDYTFYF